MIFEELFQKYRKTEPTSLFVLKNFVLILLLIAILGYTWLIIWGIYDDNPVIQNSLEEANNIPIPVVLVFASQKTNISCHFVNASGIQNCSQYIEYLPDSNGLNYFMSTFSAKDLMFSAIPNNGISSLELKIYLNDASINISDSFSQPFIGLIAIDADLLNYDIISNPLNQVLTYSKFFATLAHLNGYNLVSNHSYTVKIKRKRKEFMVPSWENYLGFSSKLENIPYYTSTLETFPLLNDPEFPTLTMLTKITIEPQTFIVQVETDKRTKTVLSSIGLIGGAWGSAATIYVILFGAIVIKPWGWIQKYGFKINKSVQTKLQSTFGFIPLVHHSKTNNLNNNELKKRLDSLQLFLTEYVVDVQYLEEIYKSNMNKKGAP